MEIRNPEVCNAMFQGERYIGILLGLAEEFPKVDALIGCVNFCDVPHTLVADSFQRYEHANNKGMIRFNKYNLSADHYQTYQTVTVDGVYAYAVPTPQGFAAHEFSHFIYWYLVEHYSKWELRRLRDDTLGKQYSVIAPRISQYAQRSPQECFAELMAVHLVDSSYLNLAPEDWDKLGLFGQAVRELIT